MSDNVRRQTKDLRKRITIYARVSIVEYEMLREIARIRGTDNESQVIREAIRVYYGLLSGAREVKAGEIGGGVVIQNPIVNIVEARAESRASSSVSLRLESGLEDLAAGLEEMDARLERLERLLRVAVRNLEGNRAYLARTNLEDALRQLRALRMGSRQALSTARDLLERLGGN